MSLPKVFISYSHDSIDHKKWVLDFATKLRASGVDATLDQWDLKPGDDLAVFMEKNLREADRVLMICSETYVDKANKGIGGVGYEKMIVTADLLARIDSNKVIPIIRQSGKTSVPTFLQTKLHLNFSSDNDFEFQFDELIRTLHNSPVYEKPPVTRSKFPTSPNPAKAKTDGVLQIMKIVIDVFESSNMDLLLYEKILQRTTSSRVLIDILLSECEDQGLITRQGMFFSVTAKGKIYAINNEIIKR